MTSTFSKDWTAPRSIRAFNGYVSSGNSPSGTVFHAVTNSKIPCTSEEADKFGKSHISVTIVGIKNIGYAYAPWKKPTKGGAKAEGPTKKLFEDPTSVQMGRESIYSSVKVYGFPREGKTDKGPRDDTVCGLAEVGHTYHFRLHDFMFERKSKGESVFPDNVSVIDPFQIIEITLSPCTVEQCKNGYGLQIATIRPTTISMYSYLTPGVISMLSTSYDTLQKSILEKVKDEHSSAYILRNILDNSNLGYLAKCAPGTYLSDDSPNENWFKLTHADANVITGIQELDVNKKDLMRYMNAGSNELFPRLLVELAAACGALYCWVAKNEYYGKVDKDLTHWRCMPLIDTDVLLDFIDVNMTTDSEDTQTTIHIPYEIPNLQDPVVTIKHTPDAPIPGDSPITCSDFVLAALNVACDRGYYLCIGTTTNPSIMPMIFRSSGGAGTKRGGGGRVDWSTFVA